MTDPTPDASGPPGGRAVVRSLPSWTGDRRGSARLLPVLAVGSVLVFLFAVKLLGAATEAAAPTLADLLPRVVVADPAALGVGWLAAYALANGSVVAAIGLSLFRVGLLTTVQLFLVIAGSRLGAAAVVVFVGALDHFQHERYSLPESVSLGLLTFLLTLSIYLPVTVVGYVLLPWLSDGFLALSGGWVERLHVPRPFDALTAAITAAVGPGLSVLLAVVALFASLRLFDRVLARVDTGTLRRRVFGHLDRTWLSFAIGLFVTGATTSVAFSLGVIVPLYNRRYVQRDELIPYVLGANVGTLFDTLLVALVLESPSGVAVVLLLLSVSCLTTLSALLVHDRYCSLVSRADDWLVADRRAFLAFVALLLAVPLALLVVPLATVGILTP
jgi:sodium-dependent phosphate cotransporter